MTGIDEPRLADATDPDRVARLTLAGELDLSSAHAPLEAALQIFAAEPVECVLVDLSSVTFIDSSGLGGLVQLSNYARSRGARVELAGASERVRAVLELSGLASVLPFENVMRMPD